MIQVQQPTERQSGKTEVSSQLPRMHARGTLIPIYSTPECKVRNPVEGSLSILPVSVLFVECRCGTRTCQINYLAKH